MNSYAYKTSPTVFNVSNYNTLVHRLETDLKVSGITVRKKKFVEFLIIVAVIAFISVNIATDVAKDIDKKNKRDNFTEENNKTKEELIKAEQKIDNLKIELNEMAEEINIVKKDLVKNNALIKANKKVLLDNQKLIKQNFQDLVKNALELESFDHQLDKDFQFSLVHFKMLNENLDKVFNTIDSTRNDILNDIKNAQNEILSVIYKNEIDMLVNHLNNFIQFFIIESKKLITFSIKQRVVKLEKKNGLLDFLGKIDDTTENGDLSLHFMLEKIIQRKWAFVKYANDKNAEKMLSLLVYGTQIYSIIGMFVIQQYMFLANVYQLKNDVLMFNHHYENVLKTFAHFSINLLSKQEKEENSGLILKVMNLLKNTIDQGYCTESIENYATDSIKNFQKIAQNFVTVGKLFSSEKPIFNPSIHFPNTNNSKQFILANSTQFEWFNAKKVYYALQFFDLQTNSSSLISEWSEATVTDYACPFISDIPQSAGKLQVIYRKIDNGKPQVVVLLNNEGNLVSSFRDINRDLFNAAFQLNEQLAVQDLELYIAAGADVNAFFDNDKRPIHVALENGSKQVAKKLIETGAFLNVSDCNGNTPLYIATQRGNADVVNVLINLGVDINAKTDNAYHSLTSLHAAVLKNHTVIVDLLLKNPFLNVNAQMSDGSTALHLAASLDNVEIVQKFLNLSFNQTNFNAQNKKKYTALHLAVLGNATNSLKLLLNFSKHKKIDINAKSSGNLITPLHLAAMYGQNQTTSLLLFHGADVNALTANRSSAMHFAAYSGKSSIIKQFAASNQELCNEQNYLEMTPLYTAYRYNNTSAASMLLKNCARLDIRLKNEKTFLHLAAQYGHTIAVLNFIQANISVDAVDRLNFTPLHYAILNNHFETVKILLEKNANVNLANSEGQTPLHMVMFNDEIVALNIARMLVLEYGADVNAKTREVKGEKSKMTLLHWAAQLNYLSLAKFLINYGAHFNATNSLKQTPLHLAATFGHFLMTNFLITKFNISDYVEAKTTNQQTALHLASMNAHFNVSQILILNGKASLNVFDNFNRTPLLYLVQSKKCTFDMYNFYISNKADIFVKDSNSLTLFYYAVANNFTKIAIDFLSKNNQTESDYENDPIFFSDPKTNFTSFYYASKANNMVIVQAIIEQTNKYINGKKYFLEKKNSDEIATVFSFFTGNTTWNNFKKFFLNDDKTWFFNLKPLPIVVKYNRLDFLEHLENEDTDHTMNYANDAFKGLKAVHYAARIGNQQMLEYLLNKTNNINDPDFNGNTPIFHAVEGNGNLTMIKYLVNNNAKYQTEINKNGFSLSDIAVRSNKTDIAIYLINKNVNYKDVDLDGLTPLHISASLNNLKLSKILLKSKNYDVNALDKKNQTPLYKSIDNNGQLKLIKFLVQNGANIKKFDTNSSNSYVHQALIRKKFNIAKYLINEYSDINTAGFSKETPMHEAVRQNSIEIVELLLQKGAFMQINKKSITPFEIALNNRNENLNENMLNYFVFMYKSKQGKKSIHEAASAGKVKMLLFLLQKGVFVNTRDNLLMTPLHFAALNGELEIVKILSKQKCFDVQAKEANNKTAYDLAEINNRQDILNYLSTLMVNNKVYYPFNKLTSKNNFFKLDNLNLNNSINKNFQKNIEKKYIFPDNFLLSVKKAQTYALNISDSFQEMLEQLVFMYKIILIERNYLKFYQELKQILINGKFDKIENKLIDETKKAIPENVLNKQKKIKNFLLNNIDCILQKFYKSLLK